MYSFPSTPTPIPGTPILSASYPNYLYPKIPSKFCFQLPIQPNFPSHVGSPNYPVHSSRAFLDYNTTILCPTCLFTIRPFNYPTPSIQLANTKSSFNYSASSIQHNLTCLPIPTCHNSQSSSNFPVSTTHCHQKPTCQATTFSDIHSHYDSTTNYGILASSHSLAQTYRSCLHHPVPTLYFPTCPPTTIISGFLVFLLFNPFSIRKLIGVLTGRKNWEIKQCLHVVTHFVDTMTT